MKLTYKYISLAVIPLMLLFTVSCDDFLDINDDPNNPLEVPVGQLLPSIQVDISGALGTSSGGLTQYTSTYMHHITQRGTDANDYGFAGGDFGVITPWNVFYSRALKDNEDMIDQAREIDAYAYMAIGFIQKAYSFSILVDLYGDVPYSEAFQGSDNLNPAYDQGEAIYPQLYALLDSAILLVDQIEAGTILSSFTPSVEDLIYAGNMRSWRSAAKTIKLKMLMNESALNAGGVSAEIQALITEGDLITADIDFELDHGNTVSPDDRNPGWVQEYGSGNPNYYVSPYLFEIMANINTFGHNGYDIGIPDPRLPYYMFNQLPPGSGDGDAENPCSYCPSRSGTSFLSIWAFSFNIDPNEGFDQALSQTVLGLYYYGGAYDDGSGTGGIGIGQSLGYPQAPQRFITEADRYFMEAELALLGISTGDARVALEAGTRSAFAKVNEYASGAGAPSIADSTIDQYVTAMLADYDAGTTDRQWEHIATQKWLAGFGTGVDLFTDFRRRGGNFPILHDGNTDNLATTVRTRSFPNAYPWPTGSLDLNSSAPRQKDIISQEAKPFWMP